jgi:DNA adenine methylase
MLSTELISGRGVALGSVDRPLPFLRWAGSKRQLLPTLRSFWHTGFNRYLEPFAGSACLFFDLMPREALLGDVNRELMNAFRCIKRHPTRVGTALTSLPRGKRAFYRIRREDPVELPSLEAAARFIFLNRFCFNGLFRTNSAGRFNVPYGGAKVGHLPTVGELRRAARALKSATLICGDFERVLEHASAGDFVYLDPPFAVENRRVFRQYGPQTFGLNDLTRLAGALEELDFRGAAFVVSYAYCAEALKAFGAWHQRKFFVNRNIAGFRRFRRRAAELIVTNIP